MLGIMGLLGLMFGGVAADAVATADEDRDDAPHGGDGGADGDDASPPDSTVGAFLQSEFVTMVAGSAGASGLLAGGGPDGGMEDAPDDALDGGASEHGALEPVQDAPAESTGAQPDTMQTGVPVHSGDGVVFDVSSGGPALGVIYTAMSAHHGESGTTPMPGADNTAVDGAPDVPEPEFGIDLIPNVPQVLAQQGGGILSGGTAGDLLTGGAGMDLIGGRDGDDLIAGADGDDHLQGEGGNDAILGGAGDDSAAGGSGDDLLLGGNGDDTLAGHVGDDTLGGGGGDDSLIGGDGADTLAGGAGDDTLAGGYGADLLISGAGNDLVFGGAGDDTLLGGGPGAEPSADAGADTLNGGAGDDVVVAGSGDIAHGGSGSDSFVLGDWIAEGAIAAHLADFDPAEDRLIVVYDAAAHPDPELSVDEVPDDPETLELRLDGALLATVAGGQGVAPQDVTLLAYRPG